MTSEDDLYDHLLLDCQTQLHSLQHFFSQNLCQTSPFALEPQDLHDQPDHQIIQEKLYEEKKKLEEMFLEINIDIQKKRKQLGESNNELDKCQKVTDKLDKKIQEKIEFIEFLQEQLKFLNQKLL